MNKDYDDTKLPDALEDTVRTACKKAAREERRRKALRYAGLAVAACLALVVTVNIPPVAGALQDVPLVGSLVRVLQIGGGGMRTDGTTVIGDAAKGSTVRLTFQTREGASPSAPAYTVERFSAPDRLVFTLNGVRGFDLDAFEASLAGVPQVRSYYQNVILDDSAIRFTVVLQPGAAYEISEYQQPGYLDLHLSDDAAAAAPQTVWFLRSNAMPQGESLALLAEMYTTQGASAAPTRQDGQYTVMLGSFASEEEAKAYYESLGSPPEFWVDSCRSDENPSA